jgi:hypothetical protein
VYDRQVTENQVLSFGVSGMLYQNGLIMFDRQTESLWSHILGQAIGGQFKGTTLTFIPALQTDWQTWLELHPNTLVVNPRSFGRDTYGSYYASNQEGVIGRGGPPRDDDLRSKEYVIGVRLAGQARAYPFSVLNREPVVNDQIEDIPIVVFFDKATASGTVFSRELIEGTILTFETTDNPRLVVDAANRSEWDILSGEAINGPLAGTKLEPVPITYAFWFGWADYHVGGTVYRGAGES